MRMKMFIYYQIYTNLLCFPRVHITLLHFYRRPTLASIFANQKQFLLLGKKALPYQCRFFLEKQRSLTPTSRQMGDAFCLMPFWLRKGFIGIVNFQVGLWGPCKRTGVYSFPRHFLYQA